MSSNREDNRKNPEDNKKPREGRSDPNKQTTPPQSETSSETSYETSSETSSEVTVKLRDTSTNKHVLKISENLNANNTNDPNKQTTLSQSENSSVNTKDSTTGKRVVIRTDSENILSNIESISPESTMSPPPRERILRQSLKQSSKTNKRSLSKKSQKIFEKAKNIDRRDIYKRREIDNQIDSLYDDIKTYPSRTSHSLEGITLYEEFRLIERPEREINTAWKGAHLIVFFLAFVFGSFCTFCFHVLMYLFDDKCVLFPKMVSVQDLKKSNTRAFLNHFARDLESLPLDFVTTIWVDKSTCYLPVYVPLLSGISGLVWTSMFLMCSSGSQTLTGLNRPWRILPVVFCFSLVMSVLCVYTSLITDSGLEELCIKLGEVFGKPTCTYTINVATIAYERRIRGVYQAMRLTIVSAWLHTLCWISSAGLSLARVILVVDFRLVRTRADLIGNIEQMLERQEKLIRNDEFWDKEHNNNITRQLSKESLKVRFVNKGFYNNHESIYDTQDIVKPPDQATTKTNLLDGYVSEMSLITEEYWKSLMAEKSDERFANTIVQSIIDHIDTNEFKSAEKTKSPKLAEEEDNINESSSSEILDTDLDESSTSDETLEHESINTRSQSFKLETKTEDVDILKTWDLFENVSHHTLPDFKPHSSTEEIASTSVDQSSVPYSGSKEQDQIPEEQTGVFHDVTDIKNEDIKSAKVSKKIEQSDKEEDESEESEPEEISKNIGVDKLGLKQPISSDSKAKPSDEDEERPGTSRDSANIDETISPKRSKKQ